MRARYAAMFGFFIALAIVHAIVAAWTPIQADDWNHWIWAGQNSGEDNWLFRFLGSHITFSDFMGYVLARCRSVHVLVTPVMMVALVTGLFTVAMRRTPRATFEDLLALALASALFWIGQPQGGVTVFHTAHLAQYVYGATIALWFIAPLRCDWDVPRWVWPPLALAGYCAGSSSRAIGLATLVGMIIALRSTRRSRWMWIALGGLVVGVLVGYANPPWIEFGRVFRRGLEANLTGQGLLRFALQETGEIIALVAALVLLDHLLGVLGRGRATGERPDPGDTLRWAVGSFLVAIWCLFGPKYNEATLVPVTCMLAIAALPYLVWLTSSRWLRVVIIAFAVGVHVIAWSLSLATYHRFGAEGALRQTTLENTKPGAIAFVRPYEQIAPSFWFFGENLGFARLRQLLAIEGFGIRDIVLEPSFRRLEVNPGTQLVLQIEDATDEQLRAARMPTIWATELSAARKQFELFVKRLARVTGKRPTARLVVTNVELPQRGDRPLLAAWINAKQRMIPRIARSPLDENSRYTVRIYGDDARQFKEGYVIDDGKPSSAPYQRGSVRLQPLTMELNVVVLCNLERCLVADAFIPRF